MSPCEAFRAGLPFERLALFAVRVGALDDPLDPAAVSFATIGSFPRILIPRVTFHGKPRRRPPQLPPATRACEYRNQYTGGYPEIYTTLV